MFELPHAKRVRREDLRGPDDSGWACDGDDGEEGEIDAELEARLNAQIAKSLGLTRSDHGDDAGDDGHARDSGTGSDREATAAEDREDGPTIDEDGYSFRLFNTAGPTPKIVLEDAEARTEGGLVRPRPPSYYLATRPSAQARLQYEFAATTGDEVISRSRVRSWGLELPWKVTTIKVVRKAGTGEVMNRGSDDDDDGKKRKRPGKKRRMAARIKVRERMRALEAVKQKEVDKEEHLKEKKKRLNRLKKLRKRAKKKEERGDDSSDEE